MGRTTIVVTPREQFALAERSLRTILDHTEPPYELVYVDGRSPRPVRRAIEALADEHGFRVVRSERYLTPNEARNLGAAGVDTEFVTFVDNDLLVTDGWLDALVTCADETGAAAVGPLYFQGPPEHREIHMAGGDYAVEGPEGRRVFSTHHRLQGVRLEDLDAPLEREQVDFVEFHCMLLRTEVLRAVGPLDERLRSTREHLDLCLDLEARGEEVWFEPASLVTYKTPPPVPLADLRYYLLRWSDDWYRESLERFVDKRGLDPSYLDRVSFAAERRKIAFAPTKQRVRRVVGDRTADRLGAARDRLVGH